MMTISLEEMRTQKVVSVERQPAPIGSVEKELDAMWEGFRMGWGDEDAVTRACMSNLLVYCDTPEEAEQARQDLPKILFEHPARTLLMYRDMTRDNDDLASWVSVHFSNLGHGLQVCGEQVDVVCRGNAEVILPSAARSLLVSDLPTALWWASAVPPALNGQMFMALSAIADQVIFDSVGWRDPPRDILALARWTSSDQDELVIHNLAWRRLKPWRRMLSQVLDPAASPGALAGAAEIHLEHGPHGLPTAWMLIGWVAERLGWTVEDGKILSGKEMIWTFRTAAGPKVVHIERRDAGEPAIYRLDWTWRGDHSGCLRVDLTDNRKLEARTNAEGPAVMILPLHQPDRATLVAQQLAYRTRDRLFENALSLANAMTQVLSRR
jgi:glucose-6-phosphate dehydrogenase assembly protein OpcA